MRSETAIAAPEVPERPPRSLDQRIAALAHRQHGVVSLAQLVEAGLGERAVRKRAAGGRLHRVHRGVYAVGRPGLTVEGLYMAAVLACGPGAVLSHASAAHHLDLLPKPCTHPVHATVPGRAGRRRRGIRSHAGTPEHAVVDGIPVTTIGQTILDLAAIGRHRDAERAIDRADEVHRYDVARLHPLMDGRAGTAVVRTLLASPAPPARTRSDLEEAFLGLCRGYGLPAPTVNVWIPFPEGGGAEADFCWPQARAIVETDSLTFHRTQAAMAHDYLRDQRLELLGWRLRRVAWHQVFHDPGHVARVTRAVVG